VLGPARPAGDELAQATQNFTLSQGRAPTLELRGVTAPGLPSPGRIEAGSGDLKFV
jgi:hypothetical protein